MKNLDAQPVWRSVAADAVVTNYKGKRIFDVVASLSLSLIFAPLALSVGVLVWKQSGRPVFFRHYRIGKGGVGFDVYKFRSMLEDSDSKLQALLASDPAAAIEWAQTHKLKNDPRVTPVGRFLRKTSLDELPQLINVLRGEMSLVGPRPVVGQELEKYGSSLPYYLSIKPGLTGLWQISGRNDISYEQRVALDVEYARTQSLLGDICIAAKTARVLFFDRNAY